MQLTRDNLQFLFQQFSMDFQRGYKRRKTYFDQYSEQFPSGTETNVYGWLAELPGLREWIGPRLIRNISTRSYVLTNKDFEDTFAVDKNKIADDTYGLYSRSAELLGDASARWPDDLVTDQIINGTSLLAYDGQAFFSTSHPVDIDDSSAGTFSNKLSNLPLDDTNYLNSFQTAYATMQSYNGESGKPLEVQPTILMVPPLLQKWGMLIEAGALTAQAIRNVAGAENVAAAGVNNVFQGIVKCIVNPRLSADVANTWYLFSTDRLKPLAFQQRQTPELTQMTDPTNPVVFKTRQFVYGVHARGIPGYTLPFLAIRANATTN